MDKQVVLPVVEKLIVKRENRPRIKNRPSCLAVHWTANSSAGAGALAHAAYFNNNRKQVSAHYVVDDRLVVRCVPEDEVAYGVGARRYTAWARANLGPRPNRRVISVEMCVNRDGDFWRMYSRTAHLCAMILIRHGWGIEKLIRHYDVTGKCCPAFFVRDREAYRYTGKTARQAWLNFRADVLRLMR